jgi:hypothetical protein
MPIPRHFPQLSAVIVLTAASGCAFERAPIVPLIGQDAGAATATFDAAVDVEPSSPSTDAGQTLPAQSPDAAPVMTADAATPPSAAPDAQVPAIDAAAAPDAAAPPSDAAVSGDAAAPPVGCQGVGSYGLQFSLDLTWNSTSFADPGRGSAKVYALVEVQEVDPQSHAVTATGQLCGITLAPISADMGCSRYQIRFPDALWKLATLPMPKLVGEYTCSASGCTLKIDPTSYQLGIRLDPATAPWPGPGEADAKQFVDDDRDGLPGLSAEVMSLAPLNRSCDSASSEQMPVPSMSAMAESRLLLAVRTQLTAAVELNADCSVRQASGGTGAIDLRSAGCVYPSSGSGPTQPPGMSGSASCPAQVRATIDQSLPQFHALAAGEKPNSFSVASRGPELTTVRFAPGAAVTCEQVREAKP